MKRFLCLLAVSASLPDLSTAAPVNLTAAGLTYTQNFDGLASATNNGNAVTTWADDSTLPGWWLYKAGSGTPPGFVGNAYTYRVADGATNTQGGGEFFSIGASGSNDRALSNPASTTPGELSAMVVFRHTSTLTVELTNIRHNVEVVRCNQNANLLETMFVWSRTAATMPKSRR